MKPVYLALALGLAMSSLSAPSASAGNDIKRACLSSGRSSANTGLCGCIQSVADTMLSRSEQKQGAKLFNDPHKSQEIRQSSRGADESFWLKWKAFGETASNYCS